MFIAIAITIPSKKIPQSVSGRISWSRMVKCGDGNMYIEWYHEERKFMYQSRSGHVIDDNIIHTS